MKNSTAGCLLHIGNCAVADTISPAHAVPSARSSIFDQSDNNASQLQTAIDWRRVVASLLVRRMRVWCLTAGSGAEVDRRQERLKWCALAYQQLAVGQATVRQSARQAGSGGCSTRCMQPVHTLTLCFVAQYTCTLHSPRPTGIITITTVHTTVHSITVVVSQYSTYCLYSPQYIALSCIYCSILTTAVYALPYIPYYPYPLQCSHYCIPTAIIDAVSSRNQTLA